MTNTCPMLPSFDELVSRNDRTTAWKMVLEAGDVTMSQGGTYFINGADAAEFAAKSPELFSSQGAFAALGSPIPLVPIAFDAPDHTRYRRMLDKFFSPRAMAAREPELRKHVGEMIDGIVTGGETCEVVSALAVPFPSQVFLTLFGLPLEDVDRLNEWKQAILDFTDSESPEPSPEVLKLAGELFMYLTEHIAARRGSTGTDLLSELLADREEGGMDDQEILGLCFLFVLAGLDTVTAAVGIMFNALAQDPDLRDLLVSDPSKVPGFLEEVLRVDGPVLVVPRLTTADVELGGVNIPEGSTCWLRYGAANRDERRYEDPDALHGNRTNHFAFGRGPHRCLGSHLARLELRLVVEEWHKRIPKYSLVEGTTPKLRVPVQNLQFEAVELDIRQG